MRNSLISIALFFVLCSICRAQGQEKLYPKPHSLPPVISRIEDVNIATATDKTQYEGDDSVQLFVTLQNKSEKPIVILTNAIENFYGLNIIGPDGKNLARRQPEEFIPLSKLLGYGSFADSMERQEVLPGQTKRALIWLDKVFNMSRVGTYQISANPCFLITKEGEKGVPTLINSKNTTIKVTSTPLMSKWLE